MILETITGYVTAAGTTATALTMLDRDSKTIRNYDKGTARLVDVVSFSQGTGYLRIASPGMHDPTNGIRVGHTSNDPSSLLAQGYGMQTFTPQEILTLEATGSATAGDIEMHSLTLQYDSVPGLNGRYIDEVTLAAAVEEFSTVQVDITAATTGVYSSAVAINATVDNFIANRAYAVMGISTVANQGVITIQGAETGNVRVGVPGNLAKKDIGSRYFIETTRRTGLPCIPVFNSANKSNVLIQTTNNENAASPKVYIHLALLRRDLFPQ